MRTAQLAAAAAFLILAGLVRGSWTDRWTTSRDVEEAVARLRHVPKEFGDWKGTDQEMDPRQIKQAEAAGYLSRRYENRRTGAAVSILLLCGRTGPMTHHTPDICYPSSGFELVTTPGRGPLLRVDGSARPVEMMMATLFKPGVVPIDLRISWAWSATGGWRAPDNPRWTFASSRKLYKLYIIRDLSTGSGGGREDHGFEFMKEFLPQLDRALFPGPGAPAASPRRAAS